MSTVALLGSAALAGAISARWNWWRPHAEGLAAPMYHKIGDPPPGSHLPKLWVSASDFRRQLEYLKANGYETLLFSDLRDAEEGRRPWPARPALLTFDDGYANNHELAFPLLCEYGMKANIFLVVETLDRHNAWHDPAGEPWQRMLTLPQIEEMQRSGLVEFGSHTMRHRDLARLPLEDVRWEARESKKRLEDRLGREQLGFAYPYGSAAYDPERRRLVREAGYRYDFGIKQGISPWPWSADSGPLKRLLIRGDDGMLDFHLNLTRGRARL